MKRLCKYPALTILLVIIVIGSGLLDYFTPPMGDDLIFLHQLGGEGYTCPDRGTLSFIMAHIVGCNGRLFDYMGPIFINLLPRAIAGAVMGLMAGGFFLCVLYACRLPRRGYQTLSLAVVALTLLTMPWWDSMWLRVCQFNYLWAAAFSLLYIGLFFRNPKATKLTYLLLISVFGILTGASHEQTGVALCGAFFLWLITTGDYKRLSVPRKYMLAGLLTGTLLSLASPGIWKRAAQDNYSPPLGDLLLSTLPLVILLLITISACMLSARGRRYIRSLYATEWGVIVNAAILSVPIIVFSGIPGRTGLFPEAAAIVGLTIMAQLRQKPIVKTAGVRAVSCGIIIVLACVHFAVSIREQRILMSEWDKVKDAYIDSSDGMVFYDFTNRYDVSPLTLFRVKGVADADDYWLLHAFREAYGDSVKTPVVLPSSFRDIMGNITDSISDGNVTVYASRPPNTVVTIDDAVLQYYPGAFPRVITPVRLANGRKIWIATPRVRDPGDYDMPVK